MKLILLDCDGVLVDSEILVNRKFVELLSAKVVIDIIGKLQTLL